jgi:pSer/pThr/pTyr-binding forkhead associated (FHA) protein
VLKVVFSPDTSRHGQVIPLGQGSVTIGRENCEILFAGDGKVSRRHASIAYNPTLGQYTITDLGAANGVIVNGTRLAPNVPTPLANGAIILLGPETRLMFERGG